MKRFPLIFILLLIGLFSIPDEYAKYNFVLGGGSSSTLSAQRRSRPGSIKHSDAEIEEVAKEKKTNIPAIKSGAWFHGDLYYTVDGNKMQIGEVKLFIYDDSYSLEIDFTSHQMRTLIKNRWGTVIGSKSTKMGDDITSKGKYAALEQSRKRFLRLYEDGTGNILTDLYADNAVGSRLKLIISENLFANLDCMNCSQ